MPVRSSYRFGGRLQTRLAPGGSAAISIAVAAQAGTDGPSSIPVGTMVDLYWQMLIHGFGSSIGHNHGLFDEI
jgi:hypothetical protein